MHCSPFMKLFLFAPGFASFACRARDSATAADADLPLSRLLSPPREGRSPNRRNLLVSEGSLLVGLASALSWAEAPLEVALLSPLRALDFASCTYIVKHTVHKVSKHVTHTQPWCLFRA
jgi:hypothetical protein